MMKSAKSTNGHTAVILAVDMKNFVVVKNHNIFEILRCTQEFKNTLCNDWSKTIASKKSLFSVSDNSMNSVHDFRLISDHFYGLEEFATPLYRFDSKSESAFTKLTGSEYSPLKKIASNWMIDIRATFTGFFLIRFYRMHPQERFSVSKLAKDVKDLLSVVTLKGKESVIQISVCQFIGIEVVNRFIQLVDFKLFPSSYHSPLVMMNVTIEAPIKRSIPFVTYIFDQIESIQFSEEEVLFD